METNSNFGRILSASENLLCCLFFFTFALQISDITSLIHLIFFWHSPLPIASTLFRRGSRMYNVFKTALH